MSILFTSDQHFGHANIIKFLERPFRDVHEMDQTLIDAWNDAVGPDDVVYHLGDFTLTDSLSPWIHALTFGQLIIVPGSHDWRWMRKFDQGEFGDRVVIESPLLTLEFPSGRKHPNVVALCHYPMLSWERSHYGSLHLHGHSHCTIPDSRSGDIQMPPGQKQGKRIDIGVDCWNFKPVHLEQLLGATA